MLRPSAPGSTRPLNRADGFTLIEMLVTMLAGMVVLTALFTIVDVTLHQATRTFSRIDATQRARVRLEQVENELHSACVASQVTPVQAGSSDSQLTFISQYGNAALPTPVEHQITYNSSNGTLTDSVYAVSGGTAPSWTFSASPSSTTTLLTNVSPSPGYPVFQYFSYQEAPNGSGGYYTDPDGNPYVILLDGTSPVPGTTPPVVPQASPLTTPLSASEAAQAAEVRIRLLVGATGGSLENTTSKLADVPLTITDSVVLGLTQPFNHAGPTAVFGPCD
jgi:Tfp pilus assembly protein PilV